MALEFQQAPKDNLATWDGLKKIMVRSTVVIVAFLGLLAFFTTN